jgi:hypothetical protein
MRGSLREMRIGSLLALHAQVVTANHNPRRSETLPGEATIVGPSGSVIAMKRGRTMGLPKGRGFSTIGRTIDRNGKTGKGAPRG